MVMVLRKGDAIQLFDVLFTQCYYMKMVFAKFTHFVFFYLLFVFFSNCFSDMIISRFRELFFILFISVTYFCMFMFTKLFSE